MLAQIEYLLDHRGSSEAATLHTTAPMNNPYSGAGFKALGIRSD
jgi:hypothetical protein